MGRITPRMQSKGIRRGRESEGGCGSGRGGGGTAGGSKAPRQRGVRVRDFCISTIRAREVFK
jgi:hypothetical protein